MVEWMVFTKLDPIRVLQTILLTYTKSVLNGCFIHPTYVGRRDFVKGQVSLIVDVGTPFAYSYLL